MPIFARDPDAAADRAQQRELARLGMLTPGNGSAALPGAGLPPGAGSLPGAGVMFCPYQPITSGSSRLRAWQVAPHLRKLGWRAAVIPAGCSLEERRARIARFQPDLLVLLRTLHPLNDPTLYAPSPDVPGTPCLIDIDDADYTHPDRKPALDAGLAASAGAICGSRNVARYCQQHAPFARVVWTGCEPTPGNPAPGNATPGSATEAHNANRDPIVAWGATSFTRYNHEADLVEEAIAQVAQQRPVTLHIYGARKKRYAAPMAERLRAAGTGVRVFPLLSYDKFLKNLRRAAVGLQVISPEHAYAEGKSFGKVLAYLDADSAVVASNAVDHPLFFTHGRNGLLADPTPDSWAHAIAQLLDDPADRSRMVSEARQDFHNRLTAQAAAKQLDKALRKAL
ncbi:MAG: glycosyltransferase [Planctomycetota bacterium]